MSSYCQGFLVIDRLEFMKMVFENSKARNFTYCVRPAGVSKLVLLSLL